MDIKLRCTVGSCVQSMKHLLHLGVCLFMITLKMVYIFMCCTTLASPGHNSSQICLHSMIYEHFCQVVRYLVLCLTMRKESSHWYFGGVHGITNTVIYGMPVYLGSCFQRHGQAMSI